MIEIGYMDTLGPKVAWKDTTRNLTGGGRDGVFLCAVDFDPALMKLLSIAEMDQIAAMAKADEQMGDSTP